ncbi:MAG: hypothetical protein SO067_06785 [Bacilli bacterium]|nr:hypothetical protein [Bacilli bacterium]
MTASETLNLIAKQWCSLTDLMKLAGVGRNTALVIKGTIKKDLEGKGYYVPNNAVPMQEVVKYLNIDIPYLEDRLKGLKV